ncbi:YfcE family phosphodiesterase [Methanocalculus chunghsingensis]|uniref:YfcE family phosphodiesterase n=1 Tax=Methanocalculus chunghsingensis TaxID=156457 RepID=UPI001B8C0E1B|nr:YfcE family phosphodiesterase [Methanocalculus chunghsingensis]
MAGKSKKKVDTGFCLFGAEIMGKLTEDLLSEADGVRESDDIEYIHRMRVASRRIRAALPLFTICFPGKEYKRLRKSIRAITRSLGDARDLDVQMDFLTSYLETLPDEAPPLWYAGFLPPGEETTVMVQEEEEERPAPPEPSGIITRITEVIRRMRSYLAGEMAVSVQPAPPPHSPSLRPGIECLLLRWTERRTALQPDVISAVDTFEASGVGDELLEWSRDQIISARLHDTDSHSRFAYETAYRVISKKILDIFSYERYIPDPEEVRKHHEMRISAKQLRYTIEIFRDLYPDRLKEEIQSIKHLQDLLGDMHDCDVWLEVLPAFLEEEEARVSAFFGHPGFMQFIRPGIIHLARDRRTRREDLYRSFAAYWETMKSEGLFDRLRQKILEPLVIGPQSSHLQTGSDPIRIAFISDIHGNLPALDAVLEDAGRRGVSHILHLGDLVGFGPFPEETIRRIRGESITGVAGNIDTDTLLMKKKNCKKKDSEKEIALCWTRRHLSKESRRYLAGLPGEIRTRAGGISLLLTHGSPVSSTGRIGPDTPDTELSEYAASTGAAVIITGHTHIPFARTIDDCLFINPGSVGRPHDGDPRASYCILQTDPLSVCHIRIPYDIDAVTDEMEAVKLPAIFKTILRHGITIDEARLLMHLPEEKDDSISAGHRSEPEFTWYEPGRRNE